MEVILYSLLGNKFNILHGEIADIDLTKQTKPISFTSQGEAYRDIKRLRVYPRPGVVYNRMVWFETENKSLAIELLEKNEYRIISDLKKTIDNHCKCIGILTMEAADDTDTI